jgi:hypothetical protein
MWAAIIVVALTIAAAAACSRCSITKVPDPAVDTTRTH